MFPSPMDIKVLLFIFTCVMQQIYWTEFFYVLWYLLFTGSRTFASLKINFKRSATCDTQKSKHSDVVKYFSYSGWPWQK